MSDKGGRKEGGSVTACTSESKRRLVHAIRSVFFVHFLRHFSPMSEGIPITSLKDALIIETESIFFSAPKNQRFPLLSD